MANFTVAMAKAKNIQYLFSQFAVCLLAIIFVDGKYNLECTHNQNIRIEAG